MYTKNHSFRSSEKLFSVNGMTARMIFVFYVYCSNTSFPGMEFSARGGSSPVREMEIRSEGRTSGLDAELGKRESES